MNIKESIEILAKQGIRVDKIAKNQFKIWYAGGQVCSPYVGGDSKRSEGVWRGREVISWAKHPHHISKGLLKQDDNATNRRVTRDKIKTEKWDDIPQEGKAGGADRWSYD